MVLLGAEINAEAEKQTRKHTTTGELDRSAEEPSQAGVAAGADAVLDAACARLRASSQEWLAVGVLAAGSCRSRWRRP
jgi:hypothetical protein